MFQPIVSHRRPVAEPTPDPQLVRRRLHQERSYTEALLVQPLGELAGWADESQMRRQSEEQRERGPRRSGSRASALISADLEHAALLQRVAEGCRRSLSEIDHALARLDAGSYGVCEGCRNPIPNERLKIIPESRLCVDCQTASTRVRPLDR